MQSLWSAPAVVGDQSAVQCRRRWDGGISGALARRQPRRDVLGTELPRHCTERVGAPPDARASPSRVAWAADARLGGGVKAGAAMRTSAGAEQRRGETSVEAPLQTGVLAGGLDPSAAPQVVAGRPAAGAVLAACLAVVLPWLPLNAEPPEAARMLPLAELSQCRPSLRDCSPQTRAEASASPWNLARVVSAQPARASGLLQMPPLALKNEYYLVRAGESEYESSGILHTNPVDKTSVTSGLSSAGKKQAVAVARQLLRDGACEADCWLWPSLTQRSYQTAEIIAYVNGISYSRIVPEYSFLDARGVGAYEGQPLDVLDEIYKADSESERLRPPRYTDGTPNESVHDVFVRVRQMMSVIETQYTGETVVIVAPDSDNLSILEAALTGLDLKSHYQLHYAPGEVRKLTLDENVVREEPLTGLVKMS